MKNIIKKVWQKINKVRDCELAAWLSIGHSILSYFYSASFFEYNIEGEIEKRNKLLVTIVFFVVMYFAYLGLIRVVRNRQKYKGYIKCGAAYFGFLMLVLLLVWPGIWRNDDMQTAMMAKEYVLDGWQHAMTSLLYMVSYRLIPFFSGVIIVQCAIVSIITSYLYNTILIFLRIKKFLFRFILWIPFLLLPVIDSILYPLRPILYSYILVLLVCLIVKCILCKKISAFEIALIVVLFIFGLSWRSEGLYLAVVAVVFWWYLVRKGWLVFKVAVYAIVAIVFGALIVRSFENTTLDTWHQNSYRVSGTIEIAVPLARRAYMDNENESELAAINEVINMEYVMQNPEARGEAVFWSDGGMKNDYTSEEVTDYLKAIVKLGLKYPGIVLNNRFEEFMTTSAMKDDMGNVIWNTTSNYDGSQQPRIQSFIDQGGPIMQPWNITLRKAVIRVLEGRNITNYGDTILTYPIFWNLVVPIISIVVFAVLMFCKREIGVGLAVSSILVKTVVVFITAPGGYHMYYFAEYLLGYILLAIMIVWLCTLMGKDRQSDETQKTSKSKNNRERSKK